MPSISIAQAPQPEVTAIRRLVGTDRDPQAVAAAGGYVYWVQLRRDSGGLRRWHGRVVTVNASGARHSWPERSTRSREKLVGILWEEALRDVQWRTGEGAFRIVEANA